MSEEKKPKKSADVTYVVQAWCPPVTAEQQAALEAEGFPAASGDLPSTWMDIATITVPARTNRKTVLKQALAESNLGTPENPPKLRALDTKSAEVHEPKAVQPPMEWTL